MRDIEGKELLREMIETDEETIVRTETVKVTFGQLKKLVREALKESDVTQVANEEMDAPDELVVQEDPLYPGDNGLEQAHMPAPESPEMALEIPASSCAMGASLPAAMPTGDPMAADDIVALDGGTGGPDELDAVLAMIGDEPTEAELAPRAHLPKRAEPDFWDTLKF